MISSTCTKDPHCRGLTIRRWSLGCQGKRCAGNGIGGRARILLRLFYQAKKTMILILSETKGLGTWSSCISRIIVRHGIINMRILRKFGFVLESKWITMFNKVSLYSMISSSTMCTNTIYASSKSWPFPLRFVLTILAIRDDEWSEASVDGRSRRGVENSLSCWMIIEKTVSIGGRVWVA